MVTAGEVADRDGYLAFSNGILVVEVPLMYTDSELMHWWTQGWWRAYSEAHGVHVPYYADRTELTEQPRDVTKVIFFSVEDV